MSANSGSWLCKIIVGTPATRFPAVQYMSQWLIGGETPTFEMEPASMNVVDGVVKIPPGSEEKHPLSDELPASR
ncbi:hypothetical protein HPB52_003956 [Rhipicephalus sanguineus]|uniref:Uncharacterized protein n=1 Tax=Rhipicephalus sanguineus TaxID=34632 RepID=A0A9D4PBN7_RHISA|nr:hypothetical protein HPB52_003956 [Rhipicephalus sanguineus]